MRQSDPGAALTTSANWSGLLVEFATVKPDVIESGGVRQRGITRHVAA